MISPKSGSSGKVLACRSGEILPSMNEDNSRGEGRSPLGIIGDPGIRKNSKKLCGNVSSGLDLKLNLSEGGGVENGENSQEALGAGASPKSLDTSYGYEQ